MSTNKTLTKQQIANKIWESANKLRSKIDANEYKNIVLGLLFYKFLCQKQEDFLVQNGINKESMFLLRDEEHIKDFDFSQDDIAFDSVEAVKTTIEGCRNDLGFFIKFEHLYQTWTNPKYNKEFQFNAAIMNDAISSFDSSLTEDKKALYVRIFELFRDNIKQLGSNRDEQTQSLAKLIDILQIIPFNSQQYDVLGFVYEYLISHFASSAGKKGGEFYTPHEVSNLMSQIVTYHLRDKKTIKVYDPTSGSASLLLTIKDAFKKYNKDSSPVTYYAQELNSNTFNLTRMNLVMNDINPADIHVRHGDTLERDWPYIDENGNFTLETMHAVVSNPPYSQPWNPEGKEVENRYVEYGLAPKSKADYAFLLHDLYHLEHDGIMAIVLPHGVLFRGGSEKQIRQRLVEKGQIDAIIGLPSNIFFGTGISTIIMILKKQKSGRDIQFIDASKMYIKDGKNNKLDYKHVKKIVDTVNYRLEIDKFSRIVSFEEIEQNDFNLNISRYLDNFQKDESFDLYSSMFGGVSEQELSQHNTFFNSFGQIKNKLFTPVKHNYYSILANQNDAIRNAIDSDAYVKKYLEQFDEISNKLTQFIDQNTENLHKISKLSASDFEEKVVDYIFKEVQDIDLIEKYDIYQIFMNHVNTLKNDIELISKFNFTDSQNDIKILLDDTLDVKFNKKSGLVEEWESELISNELICKTFFAGANYSIKQTNDKIDDLNSEVEQLIESIDEEDKVAPLFDENGKFIKKEINTYIKQNIDKNTEFDEDCIEFKLLKINELLNKVKPLTTSLNENIKGLIQDSYNKYLALTSEEVYELLIEKWMNQIKIDILKLGQDVIEDYIAKFEKLEAKYKDTLNDINDQIRQNETELVSLLSDLKGEEADMLAIDELIKILGGGDEK
ncbi:type I restriction-modification system subunit M [Mycoplasma simbae]|uniref:type I restriction-modification system subunit M n=1 Tax=Mycoplasma simbae TaxID=36744 RepID=UPI00049510C5|nr:type I restriction-modification system subunit M [Mycoplasma simbae]